MKVVIIGGVAGGASCAARLRRLDEQAEIMMLERGEHISFASCGLPYYVGGEIEREDALTLQTPEAFSARFNVDVWVRATATAIDRDAKTVRVEHDGEVFYEPYDVLVLAPGAEPIRPDLPGLDLPGVFTLRTIPDANAIRRFIKQRDARRAVIVGGGSIGLEMAENLVNAGLSVRIVEAANQVLPHLDPDVACEAQGYLKYQGMELSLGMPLARVERDGDSLRVFAGGKNFLADLVLLSIGVRPESSLAADAGLALSERGLIRVDERMRTSAPGVYAVGDAVEVTHLVSGERLGVPLAGTANKQGRVAADNIAGLDSVYQGTQGSSILKLFDITLAMTGLSEKVASAAGISYEKSFTYSSSHATYYPGAGHLSIKTLFDPESGRILGAQLVGTAGVDKHCDVIATAIRLGATAKDLANLELCYAPPFSSAKDPVNMAGFVMENVLNGQVRQFHWHDVDDLPRDGSVTLLDVRTPWEHARSWIHGFENIPLDELRGRLSELDPAKPVYVHCHSGQRSYLACRILSQHGYTCHNLSGGYRLYAANAQNASHFTSPCVEPNHPSVI